jgi:predicted branched-subunit amino acid permease
MAERWADIRDGLVLGLTFLPVTIVVAKVGLQSGLEPLAVLVTAAFVASAAVQLILYQYIAGSGETGLLAWVLIIMVSLRLVLYSCDLNRSTKGRPLRERLLSAFFLGDTAFLEFKRLAMAGDGDDRALVRFNRLSRTMWVCAQVGTVVGLSADITLPDLPKEAVNILIFSCLALTVLSKSEAR